MYTSAIPDLFPRVPKGVLTFGSIDMTSMMFTRPYKIVISSRSQFRGPGSSLTPFVGYYPSATLLQSGSAPSSLVKSIDSRRGSTLIFVLITHRNFPCLYWLFNCLQVIYQLVRIGYLNSSF